ncbi:MAG: plasmid replication protein, CyRepA1 family, partial [Elainellaceae cyanobacterium]
DEVVSVIKHALLSSTLKDKRQKCLAKLEQAIKRASVVLAWDGNCADIAINYLAALRGADCRVLKKLNQYRADALHVEMVRGGHLRDYSPVVKKINETLEALHTLKSGGAIAIISDSQRQCEALDDTYSAKGYKVLRIDSKTISEPWAKTFLKNPDRYIEQEQPDVLIMSPTAESGIDISIKDYFKKGFAFFFGVIDTDTQLQFLRRVRDLRDWCCWCQEYTTLDDWEGTRSPFARSLQKNFLDALQMDAIAALEGEPEHKHLNALMSDLKQQASNPHTQAALQFIAARNYERSHTRECLQERLEQHGHKVTLIDAEQDIESRDEIQQAKEQIQVAHSNSVFHAENISISEAFAITSSFGASLEDRYSAEKAILKAKLPGIELTATWSPEFIRRVLFQDRALLARLERFWMLNHMDAAKNRQAEQWREIMQHGASFTDISTGYIFLNALKHLDILALLDGKSYSADSPEIQKIYQQCKRSKRLQTALGRSPGKLSSMDFVGRLMAAIGVVSSSNIGARDEKGDRDRTYSYLSPETDADTQNVLNCFQNRFENYLNLESAESTDSSNSEVDHLTPKIDTDIGQGDPFKIPLVSTVEGDRQNSLFQQGDRVRFGTSLSDWEVLSIEGSTAKIRIINGCGYHTVTNQPLEKLEAAS